MIVIYFLDETDFNEEISTSLTGLLSLMHKSEETSSHRCCIMKIEHRYYCSTPFDDFYEENRAIRLIGVFCNRLQDEKESVKQISIFDDFNKLEKEEQINKLVKEVNKIFGSDTIKKGVK